jgi:hypothetical protein
MNSLFFVTGEAGAITTVKLKSVNEDVHVHYAVCPGMSAHILNIFIETINRPRRVRLSPHDSGTVNVLRTILVLSSAHDCAHASVSGHLNAGWILWDQQRELRSK